MQKIKCEYSKEVNEENIPLTIIVTITNANKNDLKKINNLVKSCIKER